MTLLVLFIVAVAAVVALLAHRDLRRADEKRRRREWQRRSPQFASIAKSFDQLKFTIQADLRPFVEAMNQVARDFAKATDATRWSDAYRRYVNCRWCRILARVGLSHHAVHYVPRHRAATR